MIRVIIVDDEILSRMGMQSFFQSDEEIYVAGVFSSAEEAIMFLQKSPVDIVITDIEMADMNGLALIEEIRSHHLAAATIIVSCHNDFSYAQEAISKGTDSYLLKFDITAESLIKEVKKVYKKSGGLGSMAPIADTGIRELPDDMVYQVGVLHLFETDGNKENEMMEGTILYNLFHEIVERYQMGILRAPYDQVMHVIFLNSPKLTSDERKRKTEKEIRLLDRNIGQYINNSLFVGLSEEFRDRDQLKEAYHQAVVASEMCFYGQRRNFLFSEVKNKSVQPLGFEADKILSEEGREFFLRQLQEKLSYARKERIRVGRLKEQLLQELTRLFYDMYTLCGEPEMTEKRNYTESDFFHAVTTSQNIHDLQERVSETFFLQKKEMLELVRHNEFMPVFQFIEEHLSEHIQLEDLAGILCISVGAFSRKFKEQTGRTPVTYINERRINLALKLLKNHTYTLWQVSDLTGFKSPNYLTRVFQKVTGRTISSYRQAFQEKMTGDADAGRKEDFE